MKLLVTSDTHFSSRPKDQYRLQLFPWLIEQQEKYQTDATFLLGDLCQEKDRHESGLVNQIVHGLTLLKPPVYILKGNHDYIDADMPYFKFVSHIEGVEFVAKPLFLEEYSVVMIPHQTSYADMDLALEGLKVPEECGVFLHNTFDGAIAETGARMGGLTPPPSLYKARWAVSGDIHKPQQVGPITYVGSPYQVRFGDDFKPRVLLISDRTNGLFFEDLYFPAPRKWSLTVRDHEEILNHKDLKKGDQIKITIELAREEVVEWAKIKDQILKACQSRSVEVYGVDMKTSSSSHERIKQEGPTGKTTEEYFKSFCVAENVPSQIKQAGLKILGG